MEKLSINQIVNLLTKLLFVFFTVISLSCEVRSARICVFSVIGFMNYRSGYDVLLESLVDKGHEVTVFSTLPLQLADNQYQRKVKYICPKEAVNHLNSFFAHVSPLEWRSKGKQEVLWDMLPIISLDICYNLLKSEESQQWLQNTKQYDMFIVDSVWNECGIAFSYVFKAKKLILFSMHSNLLSWNLDTFGAANEVSWIPDSQYDTTLPISFLQKFHFIFRTLRWHIYRNSFTFYQTEKFFRNVLNLETFPEIRELEQNASLVLVNSHFSEEYARSLPPVFVCVGGVHIRTEDSRSFKSYQRNVNGLFFKKVAIHLGNNSTEFIFMNIGCTKDTVLNLPLNSIQAILEAMQNLRPSLKFVIIWDKMFGRDIKEKPFVMPDNVLVIEECIPALNTQFLAHSQIKGFVSHGDMLDVQEAIHYAVPLILLPVAFEQDANAKRIERMGRGIRLEITQMRKDDFRHAFNQILTNETYRSNMKKASIEFRDRPVNPLKSALWWIEYVLRHSDTTSLKPLGINQTWYSRRSLDIWGCAFISIFFVVFVIISVVIRYNFGTKDEQMICLSASCDKCK